MMSNLNILSLMVLVMGLIGVILVIFILKSQVLIVSGCLLTAAGAGLNYRNRRRDSGKNRTSE